MTTTLPLRGPLAAAEALGFASSELADGAGDDVRDVAEAEAEAEGEREGEAAALPGSSSPPPTAAYTAHPSNAPGTSAANAMVRGPRRDLRGWGGSKPGPVYDTQPP
jgi:hypothetical protein